VDFKPCFESSSLSKLRFTKNPLPEAFHRKAFKYITGDIVPPLPLQIWRNIIRRANSALYSSHPSNRDIVYVFATSREVLLATISGKPYPGNNLENGAVAQIAVQAIRSMISHPRRGVKARQDLCQVIG
jgi:hypothetical protein